MEPLYKVGENTAFGYVPSSFSVVRVEQTQLSDGRFIETVIDSGNNITIMDRGFEFDVSYHPVPHPTRAGGVFMPYTEFRQPSAQAAAAPDAEWVDVSGSDQDYWRVLCDYWDPRFDLTIVEHDVVWRADIGKTFDTCSESWCVFGYDDHGPAEAEMWANMLGCTRFRKELIAAVPEAVSSVEERFRDWHYLCDGLARNLRADGYSHHFHEPPVHHDHG